MGVSGAVSQNQEYGLVLIHFPVRGATRHAEQQQRLQRISIHAPREGSDSCPVCGCLLSLPFQSTLPARGATTVRPSELEAKVISIHAPREGSDFERMRTKGQMIRISIHAPREGSDKCNTGSLRNVPRFQSTLPARGATEAGKAGRLIHPNFNPRSPRGERPRKISFGDNDPQFQSTLPARGATWSYSTILRIDWAFQSTLPARGATQLSQNCWYQ